MRLATCPACGMGPAMAAGSLVMCSCGMSARTISTWNDLARLIETGRLVEAMPEYHSLNHHPVADDPPWFVRNENCADAEGKTPLEALRKAAKAGKWKVKK